MAKAKRLRSEFVIGVDGTRPAPLGRDGQPEDRHRRGRGRRSPARAAERGEDAAVSDCRRHARVGGRAPQVPLSRSAAAAAAGQHRPAPSRDDGDPAVLRQERVLGDRDADPDQVDARRRARLPRAEPRAPGRVLRAAAVAAAVQADPDDLRRRPLRPDLPVLPRRGPARRPPARVHAGGRRDVVRAAGDDLRRHRAADAGDLRGRRPRRSRRRSSACRTRRRWRSTDPTSRTCGAACRSRICASCSASRASACSGRSSPAAAPSAGSSIKNAGGYSRSEVDGIVDQAKQLGAAGLVWARRAEDGTITSSIMKALGEAEVRRMLDAASAGNGDILLVAAGEPDATSKLLGQLRLTLAKQKGLLNPDEYRLHVGRGLSFAGVGRGGEALRLDAPPVHVAARRGPRPARDRARARCAPRPTTSC